MPTFATIHLIFNFLIPFFCSFLMYQGEYQETISNSLFAITFCRRTFLTSSCVYLNVMRGKGYTFPGPFNDRIIFLPSFYFQCNSNAFNQRVKIIFTLIEDILVKILVSVSCSKVKSNRHVNISFLRYITDFSQE